jgi:hypothetical protein
VPAWLEAGPYLAAVVMGLPLGRFVFVLVNWNRIQILCFKNLVAIKAADVIHPIAPVEKFGSLVLTAWHSEIYLF